MVGYGSLENSTELSGKMSEGRVTGLSEQKIVWSPKKSIQNCVTKRLYINMYLYIID
jgi:hypothetical protein